MSVWIATSTFPNHALEGNRLLGILRIAKARSNPADLLPLA